jgi:hypothetical protein
MSGYHLAGLRLPCNQYDPPPYFGRASSTENLCSQVFGRAIADTTVILITIHSWPTLLWDAS